METQGLAAGVGGFSLSMMDEIDLRLAKGLRDAEGDGPSAALLATRRVQKGPVRSLQTDAPAKPLVFAIPGDDKATRTQDLRTIPPRLSACCSLALRAE